MARFFIVLVALASTLLAQEAVVRRDTQFPVELKKSIKTRSAKVGDKVEFRLNEAVLIGNGVVVPEGAKMFARVEAVQNDAPDEPHSSMGIRIDRLEWKKGTARLNGIIMSVEPTPAQSMIISRRHHPPLRIPSFMQHIRIKSHIQREAYSEFISKEKDFALHSGVMFIVRQIDPDRDPARAGKDSTVDVDPDR
jgi:hypothetical protein